MAYDLHSSPPTNERYAPSRAFLVLITALVIVAAVFAAGNYWH